VRKGIAVLGSTGSIGRQTLDVVSAFPGLFEVVGLSTKGYRDIFEEQIKKFRPKITSNSDDDSGKGLIKIAAHPKVDIVVMSIVGTAGLPATIAAIKAGKTVALASKEVLVAAGDIVMPLAKKHNVQILPLDSEHSAIFQALQGEILNSKSETLNASTGPSTSSGWRAQSSHSASRAQSRDKSKIQNPNDKIKRIILTASGGPFRTYSEKQLTKVKAKDALNHPTWQMGPKITIDCSTLMNKGLEVIEAHHLFGVPYEKIEVVVHPQSIIHSMVEFVDGVVIAQLGVPDMRTPIQYALTYPERKPNMHGSINFYDLKQMTFEKPDTGRFPCLELAYKAGKTGGTMPAVLSAANDTAVELFLDGKIGFNDIPKTVSYVMRRHRLIRKPSLHQILEAEFWARETARQI
jgi:1-deoxy-D-xylulose-5-phosphate reductoisomerase